MMNKKLITIVLVIGGFSVAAQKKLVPVTQSALTGITLPAGSKQDNRMLMVSAAEMLLEMESKKGNTTISATEVLILPAPASNAFTEDSLAAKLKDLGWKKTVIEADKKYSWLQKEKQYVIMYFSPGKKETSLYFARADSIPKENSKVNNTVNSQSQLPVTAVAQNNPVQTSKPIAKTGFAFSTTNFDDGWTATEQEDWVIVTKNNVKVLLHYPKAGTIFPADPGPMTNAAWDILVAPRYSNLKNYKTAYISTYDRPYLGMGYATENATGRNVFVVFFHQGQADWLEFITPDKNTFIQQYKFDPEGIQWDSESDLMIPLLNMTSYNKFAIAASDFNGKWTSDYTGIQQLYNVYTGNYAGMNMNQSNEEFIFGAGNSYNWKLLVVNGMVGNMQYTQVNSAGQFTVINNWQIHFTKIENRARTYHAFWSCIKGARVLNLLDADAPGSGIYTKYGLAK